MSLRETLKRNKTVRGRRWIIKMDSNKRLREVKMIYCPEEYVKFTGAKKMYGDKALLKILEKEFNNKKE
jgi:hypothetical protein